MGKILRLLLIIAALDAVSVADAQQMILLLRHAEQSVEVADPPLTEAGQRRAPALATLLKDAGINVIYGSGIRRTTQTAEPLAKALNIEIKTYPRQDLDGFIGQLRSKHAQDRVLIVSQSLRVSRWLKGSRTSCGCHDCAQRVRQSVRDYSESRWRAGSIAFALLTKSAAGKGAKRIRSRHQLENGETDRRDDPAERAGAGG
jgi:phosphohistidine phosphatase SixA